MIFNIYYINFPKVYEIKMMLSNIIKIGGEYHLENNTENDIDYRGKLGMKFLNIFNTEGEIGKKNSKSDSQKVLETFEIKTTKSIILNEIIEKSKSISDFTNIEEGELIKINNVNLSLDNEKELRTVKLFTNGSLKGMAIPGADGIDINNLFNSMFKDYSYRMKGSIEDLNDNILIKIPLTFESEFESSYSVDDLSIGKVSLVGLYKGKIKIEALKNSFEFFTELGNSQNQNSTSAEINDSQYQENNIANNLFVRDSSNVDVKDYHYIDLLAIIQNINNPIKKTI
ncbi:hypothetical protein [Flavobacterium flavigenum]|uniref:hypothetical protein n=1 Tax=Flavobacterium flavigenum TaxID=3003258 RepID=UPI002482A8F9|nr:hypothetical protein [Flavobacterium flavigenum]